MANINIKMIFQMAFLFLNNANIKFAKKKLA